MCYHTRSVQKHNTQTYTSHMNGRLCFMHKIEATASDSGCKCVALKESLRIDGEVIMTEQMICGKQTGKRGPEQ